MSGRADPDGGHRGVGGGVYLLELAEDQPEEAGGGAHHDDAEDLPPQLLMYGPKKL